MLRLLLSRPAMLIWGVLLANWLSEERRRPQRRRRRVAYARDDEGGPDRAPAQFRGAGPGSMRERQRGWDNVDEAGDETFPASDPPAY